MLRCQDFFRFQILISALSAHRVILVKPVVFSFLGFTDCARAGQAGVKRCSHLKKIYFCTHFFKFRLVVFFCFGKFDRFFAPALVANVGPIPKFYITLHSFALGAGFTNFIHCLRFNQMHKRRIVLVHNLLGQKLCNNPAHHGPNRIVNYLIALRLRPCMSESVYLLCSYH